MAPPLSALAVSPSQLGEIVDVIRLAATAKPDRERQAELGQFFTPAPVANLVAGLGGPRPGSVRLLDPGAGVGSLTAAWIEHACSQSDRPDRISVVAYEIDAALAPFLRQTLDLCRDVCVKLGISLDYIIEQEDFISAAARHSTGGFFGSEWPDFDVAILNPPYKKFRNDSAERRALRTMGIETSNLYAAFVAAALRSLRSGGELLAITPRSFCNGPYFAAFRKDLLRHGNLTHLHTFGSRGTAFAVDAVLQENVVFRIERGSLQAEEVVVEWSASGLPDQVTRRTVPFSQIVRAADPDCFIHIPADEWDSRVAAMVEALTGRLELLGTQVSTGRVVDFRVKDFLRPDPTAGSVPLIYPTHLVAGSVVWPKKDSKKPNALALHQSTEDQLNPTGVYVLVKRFSAKEERRRLVAAVFTPEAAPGPFVAFENHLNYFHQRGQGLPLLLAQGLSAYLNSTLADSYFRQFNGHTQVNATDLRKLPYPSAAQLERLARRVGGTLPAQSDLDEIVEGELLDLATNRPTGKAAQQRIEEAVRVLKELGMPKEQTNERAALTLLALLDLGPKKPWANAANPLIGVTPIMEFAASQFDKHWKPNTRETVRRFTLHQFQDAGLVIPNPDKPDRPVNSPAYCYQVPSATLVLLRAVGTPRWRALVTKQLAAAPALAARYASERAMARIPLRIREGKRVTLSPGGQNPLVQQIIDEFCPRFTPGATTIYLGDADAKFGHFDHKALAGLGVSVNVHGKMPDVVVHFKQKNWLVIVEAVTSHGPINAKRRDELRKLFAKSSAPLVYVTAFLTRAAMLRHLSSIAWETEVWVADSPSHMIHFNGERFLGPYD